MANERLYRTAPGILSHAAGGEQARSGYTTRLLYALILSKKMWFVYVVGFLLGRASLGAGVYPFGMAFFWVVAHSRRRTPALGALVAVLFGMATVAPVPRLLAYAVVLFGCFIVSSADAGHGSRQSTGSWMQSLVIAGAHLGARLLFAKMFETGWESPVWIGMEALLIATVIPVWRPLAGMWDGDVVRPMAKEGWVALGLLILLLGFGLVGLHIGPLQPLELWNRLLTLGAAIVMGPAAAAAVGTCLAWVVSFTGVAPLGGWGLYALSGLLGGLFYRRGRAWVGIGYLIGHLLLSLQASSGQEVVYSIIHGLVVLAVLVVVPGSMLRRLERVMPGTRARDRLLSVREERWRDAVAERLATVSRLLQEMGHAFDVVGAADTAETGEADVINDAVERVVQRQCQRCAGYDRCWELHVKQTYEDMVSFVAASRSNVGADEATMPPRLKKRCFRVGHLVQTTQTVVSELAERERWQKRLAGHTNVVPYQLSGVASLIDGLAAQVRIDMGRADELQVALVEALHRARMPAADVKVRPLGEGTRYEVCITRSGPCDGQGQWARQVRQLVSETLEHPYEVRAEVCTKEGPCELRLGERAPYAVTHATFTASKVEGDVSGDALDIVDLPDGRVAVIISDGMGNGAQAAVQSQSAVQLLGTLLNTGFDVATAAHSINSLLLVRNGTESFATMDAVIVDRFTGAVELLKVGSAPSFIKTGNQVDVLRSAAVPLGILPEVDIRSQWRRLHDGDAIVLVTDGLLDSIDRDVDPADWMARLLQRIDENEPHTLADMVVRRVEGVRHGDWCDDVTLVVIRLAKV